MTSTFTPVAVISGGSSGIGVAAAEAVARRGYDVVLVARDAARLEAALARVDRHGNAVTTVRADLRKLDAADEVIRAVLREHGHIDALVHSAGDAVSGTVEELSDDDWDYAFDLKLGGAVRLTRAAASPLRRSPRGAIVYVAGGAGLRPGPRHAAVGAVNAALLNLMVSTALLLARDGVRVNAVAPGPVRTPRWDRLLSETAAAESRDPADVERDAAAAIPMGRIATAEEVASVIGWLVSPEASHVTGVVVPVDGGSSVA